MVMFQDEYYQSFFFFLPFFFFFKAWGWGTKQKTVVFLRATFSKAHLVSGYL